MRRFFAFNCFGCLYDGIPINLHPSIHNPKHDEQSSGKPLEPVNIEALYEDIVQLREKLSTLQRSQTTSPYDSPPPLPSAPRDDAIVVELPTTAGSVSSAVSSPSSQVALLAPAIRTSPAIVSGPAPSLAPGSTDRAPLPGMAHNESMYRQ